MIWVDFDRWLDERGIPVEQAPEAFTQWLADLSGEIVLGGPVGEASEVVAIPDGDVA